MTMRKKDYEAIARAIKTALDCEGAYIDDDGQEVPKDHPQANWWEYDDNERAGMLIHAIADYCATQDPTFKRDRFLADCGVSAMNDHSEPTWANQLWHARELLRTKGPAALTNPHAMIGRTCKCGTCFTCAAAYVMDHEYKGFWNKPRAA